jgi:hypothetical protein
MAHLVVVLVQHSSMQHDQALGRLGQQFQLALQDWLGLESEHRAWH